MLIWSAFEKFAANRVTLKIQKPCSVISNITVTRSQRKKKEKIRDQFFNIT